MKPTAKTRRILKTLDTLYPWDGRCFLHYETPWQLLFATILSAQCTDDRVNLVTATLFKTLPTLEAYTQANILDIENLVRSTGFYHAKARNLQETARKLLANFGGEVPSDINALTTLPGVGRKTANVVRGHIFNLPSVTVDTHVKRVAYKLGLTTQTDPVKIEYELMDVLPKKHWIRINQQLITHGRLVCKARRPLCGECTLRPDCERTP